MHDDTIYPISRMFLDPHIRTYYLAPRTWWSQAGPGSGTVLCYSPTLLCSPQVQTRL